MTIFVQIDQYKASASMHHSFEKKKKIKDVSWTIFVAGHIADDVFIMAGNILYILQKQKHSHLWLSDMQCCCPFP